MLELLSLECLELSWTMSIELAPVKVLELLLEMEQSTVEVAGGWHSPAIAGPMLVALDASDSARRSF